MKDLYEYLLNFYSFKYRMEINEEYVFNFESSKDCLGALSEIAKYAYDYGWDEIDIHTRLDADNNIFEIRII